MQATIQFDAHDDKTYYGGIESDFTTILRHKQFSVRILHTYAGVGITDKYKHVTYLSVYDNEDCINSMLIDRLNLELDNGLLKADFKTLFQIMEYLHA